MSSKKIKISGELSHEEIWDDSELVDSWNEALREYQRYHSLHARGETVEDVVAKAKAEAAIAAENEQDEEDANVYEDDDDGHEEDEDGEIVDEEEDMDLEESETNETLDPYMQAQEGKKPSISIPVPNGGGLVGAAALPQAMLDDSPLKNLMMSWYYAGYYTGLYEGQQMAQAQSQAHSQPSNTTRDVSSEKIVG